VADTKISAMTAASALGGTEQIPAVQSAANVAVTANQIKTFTSNSPTLITPALGTPASGTLTNCTGLPNGGLVNSSVTIGSTSVALGATAATVAGLTLTSPTLTTPALGTPASGNLANCTGYPSQVAGTTLSVQYNNAGAFAGANLWITSANTIEQYNSTTAQTLNVYNTRTDVSNYERAVFDWTTTANRLTIGTKAAGTGAVRQLDIDAQTINFKLSGSNLWTINSSGGLIGPTDNFSTIGLATGSRPKSVFAATSILVTAVNSGGGIGYGTGAGGAQTQGTSRTTGVTLNTLCGAITLVSAAGSTSWQSFTLTNSTIAATDVVRVCQKSGTDLYQIHVTNVVAGSCQITFATTSGTTTEQPVFNFAVIKAVTA